MNGYEITEKTMIEHQQKRANYDRLCNYMWDNIIKPYNDRLERERENNDNN